MYSLEKMIAREGVQSKEEVIDQNVSRKNHRKRMGKKKKKKELLLVNEKLVKINKKFEKKNSESRSHQPEAISLEVW